jgi:hypothetical protein
VVFSSTAFLPGGKNPLVIQKLTAHLRGREDVIEFHLSPTGD